MSTAEDEVRGLIESPFPKEKIELVLNGKADSSGVVTRIRLQNIREEHEVLKEIGREEGREGGYRLVSTETLYGVLALINELKAALTASTATLGRAIQDPEGFKAEMARARLLLNAAQLDATRPKD